MKDYEEFTRIKLRMQYKNNDDAYLKQLVATYGSIDAYWQAIVQEVPEEVFKTQDNDVIFMPNDENASIEQFMSQTEFLWKNLRINETIEEKNLGAILSKIKSDFEKLKNEHDLDLTSLFLGTGLSENENIRDVLSKMLKHTTGSETSKTLSKAFSSRNPEALKKLAYYLNLILQNNRTPVVGVKEPSKTIYRSLSVDRDVAKLYYQGKYLLFTSLTFAKLIPQDQIAKTKQDDVILSFEISLLSEEEQQKSNFYGVIAISDQEALISPYQIFEVIGIDEKEDAINIKLREVNNKELINTIATPNQNQNETKLTGQEKIDLKSDTQRIEAKIQELVKEVTRLNTERPNLKNQLIESYRELIKNCFAELSEEQDKEMRKLLRRRKIVIEDSQAQAFNTLNVNIKYGDKETRDGGCCGCGINRNK